jgi:hypothetical protein
MTHRPRHSGGTPGASGPPGRNYSVSKPSPAPPGERGGGGYVAPSKPKPFVDKRVDKSVSTSDVATGKFTGGTQRATPKPEPDKTFTKIAGPIQGLVSPPPKKVIPEDTGREKGIKKYVTTGLKELGKHRKKKVIGILDDPNISRTQKENVITEQNLGGAYQSLVNPILAKNPETQKITQDRIKNKRINAYGSQNFNKLDPRRHFAFNQEMSNAIREYAYSMGVTDAWGDNQFIDNLYNFTGAAHSSSMYPGTQGFQSIYAAAYQGFDAVVETYRGKVKPLEALSSGVSDFFQNIKGIWSEPKSEDQLLNDAFNKINEYVASGKHRTGSALMGQPVDSGTYLAEKFGQSVEPKTDTGEFQVAEFKKKDFGELIGDIVGRKGAYKGLLKLEERMGGTVNNDIIKSAEPELIDKENGKGFGGPGQVSDKISEMLEENKPEGAQQKNDLYWMYQGLPNQIKENLKDKIRLNIDNNNNFITVM